MTRRNESTHALTALQQALLDALWTLGPATADAVRQALLRKYPLKDSSVRTMLRRLEARGYVRHTVEGKVFVYAATMKPRRMAARAVRQLIDRFSAGSVEQFLIGLVDEKVLSVDEIQRLAKEVRSRS